MTAFKMDFPRNSSRTSTQAVTVPRTALVSAASAAIASVSLRAATASGEEITSQKLAPPFCVERQASAAIGSATTSERNVVTNPNERAVEALSFRRTVVVPPGAGRGVSAAISASGGRHPQAPLDLRHDPAGRVEPLLVDGAPASEELVVDRRLPRSPRELLGELLEHLLVHRAVAVRAENRLAGGRLQVAEEGVHV